MPQRSSLEESITPNERLRRLQALDGLDTQGQYVGNDTQDFLTDLTQLNPQEQVSPLEVLNAGGRIADYATSAPIRSALGTIGTDDSALEALLSQYGSQPETAPTGEDLARRLGLEGHAQDVAGFGIGALADASNFSPLGAIAALGVKAGAKGLGKKAARKAAMEVVENLPMDKASRLARAKKMGFNTKKTFYHGTKADIDAFDPNALGSSTNAGSAKEGYFFASDPSTASDYAMISPERSELRMRAAEKSGNEDLANKLSSEVYRDKKKDLWALEDELSVLKRNSKEQILSTKKQYEQMIETLNKKLSGEIVDKFPAPKDYMIEKLEKYKSQVEEMNEMLSKKNISHRNKRLKELPDEIEALKSSIEHEGTKDSNVLPVHLKTENPLIHDFKGERYREESYRDIMKKAKENGHDSVIFKNTYDPADKNNYVKQDIVAVFDPSQIRSTFAAFDPKKKSSGNISSGLAGAAMLDQLMQDAQLQSNQE